MRQQDILLGTKVYIASIVELAPEVKDRVLVHEYTVSRAGKHIFEIYSKTGRKSGRYDNMGFTINSMQLSPAAAVDWLERRRKQDLDLARQALARAEKRLNQDLKTIAEWRNQHAL